MSFQRVAIFFLFYSVITVVHLNGQPINSPYSKNGIGDFAYQGFANHIATGEVGIGSPTIWHINIQNPAFLIYNNFSTFQVGVNGDFRKYATSTAENNTATASLRYLAMSFPLKKGKIGTSLSLTPLTSVNYQTYLEDSLGTANRIVQSQGDGGLTQLSWSNGIRVYKSLSLGFKASYVFGQINRTEINRVTGEDVVSGHLISVTENTNYSDFLFSASMAYRLKAAENHFVNFGLTYDIPKSLEGSRDLTLARITSDGTIPTDTTEFNGHTRFTLPKSYGFGLSYEKLNQFRVGLDLSYRSWSENNSGEENQNYRNTLAIGLGVSWTPDYQSVSRYLKRASYRMGFNVRQLPYYINNTVINDFGINFGASFPVNGFSSFDTAFKFGFRGTKENGLIQENYFQVVIGATINDNSWFIKRKYD